MEVSPLFELQGVGYRYPEIAALEDVTLRVDRGERLALLGANGSGKTSLLRLLAGIAFPSAGSIRFEGVPLTERALTDDAFAFRYRRRVGMVFQNPEVQLFNPSVFDEVAFGPLQLQWPKEMVRATVETTLATLGISHLQGRAPHRLSTGEKKRVALASVLVLDPDVVLLDEPTGALDPESQSGILDFLGETGRDRTVLTTTHDLAIVPDVATRCVVLHRGRLAADGPTQTVLGDEALLRQTRLLYSHRHRHASGLVHAHPHLRPGHGHRKEW